MMKYLKFLVLFFIVLSCRTQKPIIYPKSQIISINRTLTDTHYATVQGKFIDLNPGRNKSGVYGHINFEILYKTSSDSSGRFELENLIPGYYNLHAVSGGYDDLEVDSFYVGQGEIIDIVIGLGGKVIY